MNPDLNDGVPGGIEPLVVAAAIIGNDAIALDAARLAVAEAIGPHAVPAASAIAANFSKNDRIANGCSIPFHPIMLKATTEIRAQLDCSTIFDLPSIPLGIFQVTDRG